jgi:TM2 domain-containing membrane protein YozV
VLESKPITADGEVPISPLSGKTKRHLLAALFSSILPGAGQLLLGQRRKGATLLILLAIVLTGFWPLRLLRSYAGLMLLFWGWIALYFYAACSAHLAVVKLDVQPSKWWLLLLLPFTAITMSLLGRGVTRASGFRSFAIPSSSMEKTILKGDTLIADMRFFNSRRPCRQETVTS